MKKPIDEIMAQATKGVLCADGCDVVKSFNGALIARVRGSKTDPAQDRANAALLAHWFNKGAKLLEAMKFQQYALSQWRDGEAIIFEGREIKLEEVKYLIVDPAVAEASGVEWNND